MQVTLFAHPHRMSHYHSIGTLDDNINRVRWNAVPGFAPLHKTGIWFDCLVRDPLDNLRGHEIWEDERASGNCKGVHLNNSYFQRI